MMKKLIIALLLLSSPVLSMDKIQKGLKETPEISKYCNDHLAEIYQKIRYYEQIPKNKRRLIDKIKLNFWKEELLNWKDYCLGDE